MIPTIRPLPVLAAATLLASACAQTRPARAPEPEAPYDAEARAEEGRLYVERLLCPDGYFARPDGVATGLDTHERWVETYTVRCESGAEVQVTIPPVGPLPEAPAGFELVDAAAFRGYRHAAQVAERDPLEALLDLEGALLRAPDAAPIRHLHAVVLTRVGRKEDAFRSAARAVQRCRRPAFVLDHALLAQAMGRHDAALADLREVVEGTTDAWDRRGEAMCRLGRLLEARGEPGATGYRTRGCELGDVSCCESGQRPAVRPAAAR